MERYHDDNSLRNYRLEKDCLTITSQDGRTRKMSLAIKKNQNALQRLEMDVVEPPSGMSPLMVRFCLNYAALGKLTVAYQNALTDLQQDQMDKTAAMKRAITFLKRQDVKNYLAALNDHMEDKGVAKPLEIHMFLTDIIRADIDSIDGKSPLCQEKTITEKISPDGTKTTKTVFKMPSKLEATKILNSMKGHNAAVKVDMSVKGGVMVVPMASDLEQWEDVAADSQEALMKEAIDV